MQKTVLAVALASVFSMGTAYAATELSGTSSQALGNRDYVLSGDYAITSTNKPLLNGTNPSTETPYPIHVNLNGHELRLESTFASQTLSSGLVTNVHVEGPGKIYIHATGKETVLGEGNVHLKADLVDIRTAGTYAITAVQEPFSTRFLDS